MCSEFECHHDIHTLAYISRVNKLFHKICVPYLKKSQEEYVINEQINLITCAITESNNSNKVIILLEQPLNLTVQEELRKNGYSVELLQPINDGRKQYAIMIKI